MFFLPTERLHIMFYIGISGSAFGAKVWTQISAEQRILMNFNVILRGRLSRFVPGAPITANAVARETSQPSSAINRPDNAYQGQVLRKTFC